MQKEGLCSICGRPAQPKTCILCGALVCSAHIKDGICSKHPPRSEVPRGSRFFKKEP